jgi:hypothetical protein
LGLETSLKYFLCIAKGIVNPKIEMKTNMTKEWEQDLPKPKNLIDRVCYWLANREKKKRFRKLGLIKAKPEMISEDEYKKLKAETAKLNKKAKDDNDTETSEDNIREDEEGDFLALDDDELMFSET